MASMQCIPSPSTSHRLQTTMQIPAPIRTPTFISRRRIFEKNLEYLQNCKDLNQIKRIHALIFKFNLHKDPYVAPKLISAFSLCRQMTLAVNVFDQMPQPNVHSYNTLIKAHIKNYAPVKAFDLFCQMQWCGVSPDNFTFSFLLKACTGTKWLSFVRMVHAHVEKCGFYSDLFVPNSLIDAYSKCGIVGVADAKKVFDEMLERDIVSYNSMIRGLLRAGELSEGRKMFDEMCERDRVTWNTILDGYVKAGVMDVAFTLFEEMPSRDVVSWSTMISGFVKAGDMDMARLLFDKMPVKNLVTWTIIVSGYAEQGLAKEAIMLYDQMEKVGFKPDDGTFVSILSASSKSGLLGLGRKVHGSIMKRRYRCSVVVNNALVDMYAKCGSLNKAMSIFNAMGEKDLVSWNAMIHGLAMHGDGEKALDLFSRMKREGFVPDKVTFVGLLSACSHAGLVDEGKSYFSSMESDYNIVPEIEHYGCMIDLLGRGGRLNEAFRLVNSMPFEPNVVILGALLGACRMHNAAHLAEEVHNQLVKLETNCVGNFSVLSNMYAATGDWGNFADVRAQMKKKGDYKASGTSLIDVYDELHEFTAMDMSHPESDGICKMVNGLNDHLRKDHHVPALVC